MTIVLVDPQRALVQCWLRTCQDLPGVEIVEGSIFDVECDALVSPGNSFGFMDGGLDLAISRFFGWQVQERLQERIRTRHAGELLVGQAELIPTDHARIPYVIAAPTMRVPSVLGASVNAYLALRAVLLLIAHGRLEDGRPISDAIEDLAVPGLGTGTGGMPPGICARQMRAALGDVLEQETPFPSSWAEARERHEKLSH